MEESKSPTNFKSKFQNIQRRFFKIYYGDPANNLRIIAVTGGTGTNIVANFIHNILLENNQKSELIHAGQSPLTNSKLQKALAAANQKQPTYVVLEAPAAAENAFEGIPLAIGVLANTQTPKDEQSIPEAFLFAQYSIFAQKPTFSVLNHDDEHFENFAKLVPTDTITTFGHGRDADVRISRSKIFKKGTEANLVTKNHTFDVATFATGEENAAYMAAAASAALALGLNAPDPIIDGIANYEP